MVIVIILGLIVGSFLNAVIYRLHSHESILLTHSHCQHCKRELAVSDLIPILSFILLSGRCRYCKKRISWQYPLVEGLTAIVFLLAFYQNNFVFDISLLFWLVFASLLIVIMAYDFLHYLILDKVLVPAVILALIFNLYLDLGSRCNVMSLQCHFLPGVLAGLAISLFFGLQYLISQGRWIGFGDIKLGLFLGILLGLLPSILTLMLAYVSGSIVGVALIAFNKKQMSSKLPFATFLAPAAIITMLYGQTIITRYLNLLNL